MTSTAETYTAETAREDVQQANKQLTMEQAIKFWNSSSVAGITSVDKLAYLKGKGFGEADIHQMWDQMMEGSIETTHQPSPQHVASIASRLPGQHPFGSTQEMSHQYQEGHMSHQIPALITIGGIMGLAAAASVRWLNGGDFSLFPPPTKGNEIIVEDSSLHDDEYTQDEDTLNEKLEELSGVIKSNFRKQETLLQRLVDRSSKDVFTDKSMALLKGGKANSVEQNEKVNTLLVEVYDRLDSLSKELDGSIGADLSLLLDKLDVCIKLNGGKGPSIALPIIPIAGSETESNDSTSAGSFAPVPVTEKEVVATCETEHLRRAVEQLALDNDSTALKAGSQFLYLYVFNLATFTHVPRYRKIYTANESFKSVETLAGGKELLLALGFTQEAPHVLEWKGENDEETGKKLKEAITALTILKSTTTDYDKSALAKSALAALS